MPSILSRRAVLAGMAELLSTSTCWRSAKAKAAPPRVPATHLSRFGVDRFSTRDQSAALRHAFETARGDGLSLIADPDAIYRRDGPLVLDGVSFDGQGCTITPLSDGPQVLRCLGHSWRVANVRVLGAATARSDDNMRNGIWIGDEDTYSAQDFVLENVVVDSVAPGRGVATAGIMFSNAHRGRVLAPIVRRSLADGIHITAGSSNLAIERALVEDSGDDAISIVSYRAQKRICRYIRVSNATSRRSAARGFAAVGALDVIVERFTAEESSAAGIYLYGEGGFDTFGVARCQVIDPVLTNCVTGQHLPSGFSNAAIVVGGREGDDVIDGVTVARGASACMIRRPVINGAGSACTAAISTHQFALATRITDARIRGANASRPGLASNGVEIGGQDVVVDGVKMRDIAGLAIVVLTTASGTCRLSRAEVSGSLRRPGPVDSYVYVETAPALKRMIINNSRFVGGPGRVSTSLLPPSRLQLKHNRFS